MRSLIAARHAVVSPYLEGSVHANYTRQLHRIQAYTIADSHRSVRLLEGLGFRRQGTRRDYSWEDDLAFHDRAVYGLLSTDR